MRLAVVLTVLSLLCLPSWAGAQLFPAFTQTQTSSLVGYGLNTTRGWAFTVSERIEVEELGFWDAQSNGLQASHPIGLWRNDATLVTSAIMPGSTVAPLEGTFRWVATTPVILEPSTTYVIGAYWQGVSDRSLQAGTNVVFDSRVALVEGRSINATGLSYPSNSANVDLTANFKASPVNQPPIVDAGEVG